jgi:hypothetical protein
MRARGARTSARLTIAVHLAQIRETGAGTTVATTRQREWCSWIKTGFVRHLR